MLRHGIPPRRRARRCGRCRARSARWGRRAPVTRRSHDGGELEFADRTLGGSTTAPGTRPSDTIFHDEASGELLGGDHLIKHISSNPLISRPLGGGAPATAPRALVIYLRLAARARATWTACASCCPATATSRPTTSRSSTSASPCTSAARAKILGLIAERPRTAHEIAQALWGNVAVTQAYLTLSRGARATSTCCSSAGEVVEDERRRRRALQRGLSSASTRGRVRSHEKAGRAPRALPRSRSSPSARAIASASSPVVARVGEQRRVPAGLGQRGAVGGDDRCAARHRLQAREPEALVELGQHERPRAGVEAGQGASATWPSDAHADAVARGAELRAAAAGGDDLDAVGGQAPAASSSTPRFLRVVRLATVRT